MYYFVQVVRLKFVKKFIKLIKITKCVCGRICNGCDVAVVRARQHNHSIDDTSCVETCRISLFVISTIIVIDIYVHSLVELKIKE